MRKAFWSLGAGSAGGRGKGQLGACC
jgi:hypothetical protein